MTRLVWDKVGDRRFESGLDRGVLYTTNGVGVPWNGLTAVNENPSGGDVTTFALDGVRYLGVANREEFDGTIEAFTYPDEFAIHDGSYTYASGLIATQQRRRPFALSYRTRVGNDVNGSENGYKIHIIYNVLAAPTARSYKTVGDSAEPLNFSWTFTAIPKRPNSTVKLAPLAHLIIDSTKTSIPVMRYLEEQLYGSIRQDAKLISIDNVFKLFENPQLVYSILADRATGKSRLQVSVGGTGDLIGDSGRGLYDDLPETRLVQTSTAGLYTIGAIDARPVFAEDTSNPGTFKILRSDVLYEDTSDSGFYTRYGFGIKEDPNDSGTYVNGL